MPRQDPSGLDEVGVRLLWIYISEAGALAALVGLYKARSYYPLEINFRPGVLLVLGCAIAGAGVWRLLRGARRIRDDRALVIAGMVNVITVVSALSLAELALRVTARRTDQGTRIGNVLLPPTWSEIVTMSEESIAQTIRLERYFVDDPELGWTVGDSRRSVDGMYASSAGGIRAPRSGMSFRDAPATHRIALVGDSYTFGLMVPFEHTFGHHLARMFGDDVQILNFGVDGYGVDQMFLRYQRDVAEWRPDVVVIAFVPHDLARTMAVYPMIDFGWPGYVVKPRFKLENGTLTLLEQTLPSPNDVLSAEAVGDLPLVEWDPGYMDGDWRFRTERTPLILRFLTTLIPRRPTPSGILDPGAMSSLNGALLNAFADEAILNDSKPITVYFPQSFPGIARRTLELLESPYLDLTECVESVPEDRRRVEDGHHFTNETNQAIAACLFEPLRAALEIAPLAPPEP